MMYSSLDRKISRAYKAKMLNALEAIAVMVFSLFSIALLPQLLIQYLYADQQLLEAPVLLQYIPVAFFALGAGFFVYAVVANLMLWNKVRGWEAEREDMNCECCDDGTMCCGGDCCTPNGHSEMKGMMGSASATTSMMKKPGKKKSAKK